ncbi:MAG: PadR family transcriptional regulator [Acidobacteria bacterium]|nr:PadR family transcriptional regulator [Acidobacteriota bacterium]
MNLKGTLPVLILQVLSTGDKHGYAIAQEIKQRSEGSLDFKEGSLYPALHAQEQKGLIQSMETQCDGRRRRSYRLTKAGIEALESQRSEWRQLSGAVSDILGTT